MALVGAGMKSAPWAVWTICHPKASGVMSWRVPNCRSRSATGPPGAQERGGALAQSERWLACSVSAQGEEVAVIEGVQKLAGDRGLRLVDDCLGPHVTFGRDPGQVGLHGFMMAPLGHGGGSAT